MFYAHFVLSKKGPLARIWLAAHWDKKLTRAHVFETNISSSVEAILEPKLKMALRTSGHLLLGVVRIYSRKAKYLLADCNEAFVKIKMAFRPGVDLPDDANREAAIAAITLPENIHDFEATIADLNEINMNTMTINQSRPEDITMREDFGEINLGRQDDDFGDSAFDEVSSHEAIREGDKTFGDGVYRASGRLSVHRGTDFTLHSDNDMDATLIGSERDVDKQEKHLGLTGRPDEIDIDDNDFDDNFLAPPDDDEENFGGVIDQSLFADAAIFEDPSAQKQLETLTSEIESHMGTTRFDLPGTTPVTTSGVDICGPDEMLSALQKPAEGFLPTTTAPETSTADTLTSGLLSEATATPKVTLGMTTMQTESTTLLANESEAFALPPIDTTAATGVEPRRVAKRKRRLIVDDQKSIPSEVMKSQMENTSDITTQLDLAPPTKKLMHWKETGSVDKLFTLPGRAIPSRVLQRLFARNLYTQAVPDDAPEELPQPLLTAIPFQSAAPQQEQTTASLSSDAPHSHPNSLDHSLSQVYSPALSHDAKDMLQATQKLGVITEVAEEGSNHFSSGQPSAEAIPAMDDDVDHDDDDNLDDVPLHDDLAFMVEPDTPCPAPPSVLSEAPPSVMRVDMIALERELAAADDELDHELANFKTADAASLLADDLITTDSAGHDLSSETLEERRLEKRSKVLLRMLRAHQQQHGWDESITLQNLCVNNTKKQAASKFYTILLLRKQGAVELTQKSAYTDIHISRGPNFFRLVET